MIIWRNLDPSLLANVLIRAAAKLRTRIVAARNRGVVEAQSSAPARPTPEAEKTEGRRDG